MSDLLIALLSFCAFFGAGLVGLLLHGRLPEHHRRDRSHEVLKSVLMLLTTTAGVMLAFLVGGMQDSFGKIDLATKAYGTDLVLFDTMLEEYGPGASQARALLQAYTERVEATIWTRDQRPRLDDRQAEQLMMKLTVAVLALPRETVTQAILANEAAAEVRFIANRRVQLIEQGSGGIPVSFLLLTGSWLVVCFAGFAFNAPTNTFVVACLFVGALSMAALLYLIIDLGSPFGGLTRVSNEPILMALSHMRGD